MSINNIAAQTNRGITNARDYSNEQFNVLIAPRSARGIGGFMFDVPEDDQLELNSDITDHFTEDNSYINDHIVNQPIEVTVSGFVGELVFTPPDGLEGVLSRLSSRLSVVDGFLGGYLSQQQQSINRTVSQAEQAVANVNQFLDRAQNLIAFFDGEDIEDSRQRQAFNKLRALWGAQRIMTIQTPWTYLENMAITNITFLQDDVSEDRSDISVTLKQIRFASPIRKTNYEETIVPVREEQQSEDEEDNGVVQGSEEDDATFLRRVLVDETDRSVVTDPQAILDNLQGAFGF